MKKKPNTQTTAKENQYSSVRIEPFAKDGKVGHKLYIDGAEIKGLRTIMVRFDENNIANLSLDLDSTEIVIYSALAGISMNKELTKKVEKQIRKKFLQQL